MCMLPSLLLLLSLALMLTEQVEMLDGGQLPVPTSSKLLLFSPRSAEVRSPEFSAGARNSLVYENWAYKGFR